MKLRKEWKLALLSIIAAVTLLPGCGKSSDSTGTTLSGAFGSSATGGVAYAISGTLNSSGAGNLSIGGQVGSSGNLQYFRVDGPGDEISFTATNGGISSGYTVSGFVYLSQLTVQALGSCSLSGAYISAPYGVGVVSTYQNSQYGSSNMTGPFYLVTSCGSLPM